MKKIILPVILSVVIVVLTGFIVFDMINEFDIGSNVEYVETYYDEGPFEPQFTLFTYYEINDRDYFDLDCDEYCTQERLTGKTIQYDHLTKLFDGIGEIDIYKTVFDNDLDGVFDHKTTIFLSSMPPDDELYGGEFFYDYDGIVITIIPEENLSEENISKYSDSSIVEWDMQAFLYFDNDLRANLTFLDATDRICNSDNISELVFIDDDNYVSIISTLNTEDLLKLGLALSTDNPFR